MASLGSSPTDQLAAAALVIFGSAMHSAIGYYGHDIKRVIACP
jgi:hypothetical protein